MRHVSKSGWWESPSAFEFMLAIDFPEFEVKITRGKRKGDSYTVCPVFSWKRAREVVTVRGRPSIGLTQKAKKWAEAAAAQVKSQWGADGPIPKDVQINASIVTYLPSARLIDMSNLYQGPEDILQSCRVVAPGKKGGCKSGCKRHSGVIVDDCQICSHDGSRRYIDRVHPRVEITLTPFFETYERALETIASSRRLRKRLTTKYGSLGDEAGTFLDEDQGRVCE